MKQFLEDTKRYLMQMLRTINIKEEVSREREREREREMGRGVENHPDCSLNVAVGEVAELICILEQKSLIQRSSVEHNSKLCYTLFSSTEEDLRSKYRLDFAIYATGKLSNVSDKDAAVTGMVEFGGI